MSDERTDTTVFAPDQTADYYDDADVATFYERCWGGEDIHIGRYDTGDESVAEASAAMTRLLLERAGITPGMRVLVIACGYGGTLRILAGMGCSASGVDISPHCVERARAKNEAAGLGDRIDVALGDFHAIDSDDDAWDAVVCQEAIIHSPDRPKVFAEAYRVLRPGGVFAVTDVLTAEGADMARVEAAYARLGASAGATADDYQDMARRAGFEIADVDERPEDIRTHYRKLAEALAGPVEGLDAEARTATGQSIARWRLALDRGDITWALIVARKPDGKSRSNA